MDFKKATDEQLWNIIENDWNIPSTLIGELVEEGLNRKIFDGLIKHLINKMFGRWDPERMRNYKDLYQIGYIGIVFAAKNYKENKGSFKTFAYMNIKTQFNHHKINIQAEKREIYSKMESLDVPMPSGDNKLDFLKDEHSNLENTVIKKIFWEENFNGLTEREVNVLLYFSKGYSLGEISRIYNFKSVASIHNIFHKAIKKINPDAGKVDLKKMGLMTRSKEKLAI